MTVENDSRRLVEIELEALFVLVPGSSHEGPPALAAVIPGGARGL